jgi:hypothetical protein
MQTAAQIEEAPAFARGCRGHRGNHFVPVASGDGRWTYYWLNSRQALFWRNRDVKEKAALARNLTKGCFVCRLERAMKRKVVREDEARMRCDGFLAFNKETRDRTS